MTVAELGGIKSLTMVTEMDMLMTAFEHLSTPVYAGAVPVVDSETGKLVWYISSDTLKLASESGRALGLSLSKPISGEPTFVCCLLCVSCVRACARNHSTAAGAMCNRVATAPHRLQVQPEQQHKLQNASDLHPGDPSAVPCQDRGGEQCAPGLGGGRRGPSDWCGVADQHYRGHHAVRQILRCRCVIVLASGGCVHCNGTDLFRLHEQLT